MKPKETIVLIDGNNTCFRVGWANKHLTNHGEPTGVIYGFMRDIVGVWERWKHAKIIVIWDGGTDFRLNLSKEGITNGVITEKYGYYKQNRERQREKEEAEGKINELFESVGIQKPTLLKLLSTTLVRQIKIDGIEADDIIGTMANFYGEGGHTVKIISSDKDMYQLLSEQVSIFSLGGKNSISCEAFEGEYGVSPKQWIDIGALAGDVGDNICGVHGVAEKTAIKLLTAAQKDLGLNHGEATYHDVFKHIEAKEAKKRKVKEQNVLDSKDIVHLAYKMKKIITDITCSRDIGYQKSDPRELRSMLDALGFKSIMDSVGLLSRRALT